MHSVAANVLFYNSWERVSGLKITELNISKCFFPASDCITCKDSRDARSFLIVSFSNCLAALVFVNCRITGPLIYVSLNPIMPFVLWIVRSKSCTPGVGVYPNADPSSDQKMSFFTLVFRPGL